MLLRLLVVLLGDDEQIRARLLRTDRLLLDAADRLDRAVQSELARDDDPASLVDVLTQLVDDVEREGQTGRRWPPAGRGPR